MNVVVVVAAVLSAAWYGMPLDEKNPTPGAEIVKVDADTGDVLLRRAVFSVSEDGNWVQSIHYEVRRAKRDGSEEKLLVCTVVEGKKKTCAPKPEQTAQETAWATSIVGDDKAVASLLVKGHEQALKKPSSSWTSPSGQKAVVALVDVAAGDEVEPAASVVVDVDGVRRFAWRFSWQTGMGGDVDAWARLFCGDSSCVVVAGFVNQTGRGTSTGHAVSAPFSLSDKALDVAAACATKPLVSIVANKGLVTTSGARMFAALKKAGCTVRGPDAAQKDRATDAVYAKDVNDEAAKALATSLGVTVEPLTWKSPGTIVVAIGK